MKNILLAVLILLCAGNAWAALGGTSGGTSGNPYDELYVEELLFSGGAERLSGSADEFIDFNDFSGGIVFGGASGTYNAAIYADLDNPLGARLFTTSEYLFLSDNTQVTGTLYIDKIDFSDGTALEQIQPGVVTIGNNNLIVPAGYTIAASEQPMVGVRTPVQILPKIYLQGTGALTNGTTNTKTTYIDGTPDGEWAASDGDVTRSNTASDVRYSVSLRVIFSADADAGDYIINTLASGNEDWSDRERVGFWIKSARTLAAGDMDFRITDSGAGNTDTDLPAITAGEWTWVSLDISGVDNASKDVITDIALVYTVDVAYNRVWMEFMCKWDSADETALTKDVLVDGLTQCIANPVASGTAMAWVTQIERTDYFIDYRAGAADKLVVMTDESANCFILNYPYQ